jgi:hypothetical protein
MPTGHYLSNLMETFTFSQKINALKIKFLGAHHCCFTCVLCRICGPVAAVGQDLTLEELVAG